VQSIKESPRHLHSGGTLSGRVQVPGDKSISHRALIFGAISEGITTIEGLLPAEDPISTSRCLREMGVLISPIEDKKKVQITGVGLNGLKEANRVLDCGNSGTTMRLLMGLLVGREGFHYVLNGDDSLRERPMKRVGQPLKMMGAKVQGRSGGNLAPLSIYGQKLHGAIIGTPVASAQVKSAIILAALTAEGATTVIEPARSRDHSERMLGSFGANMQIGGEMGRHITIHPDSKLIGQSINVPGDISSASFWMVAASIVPDSDIIIEKVGLNPTRTGIIDILESMGASIEIKNEIEIAGEPVGDVRVIYSGQLNAFNINGEIIPRLVDEIPILAVAGCFCKGNSLITGASELRVKETDRLAVITRQLSKMGASIEENNDGLLIKGDTKLNGANLDSETDHRIAMSLGIASIVAKSNSFLSRADASKISYPNFWNDLESLLS
tara:strand:+ start:223 stop:1545 length:1323 start_codon:yes stop_codon:yes gene_type:complete